MSVRDLGLTTVTVRTLLSHLDDSIGRADAVARRLSQAIRLGLLLDGEQLPPEAKLAEQMGVSTVTLREALAVLREQVRVPKIPSVQVMRRVHTRAGCRPSGHAGGC